MHTKGPWEAKHHRFGLWRVMLGKQIIADNIGETGAIGNDAGRDNARLIAAAPELLAILQSMADTIAMGNEPKRWDTEKTQDMLQRVIAKATGQ